MSVTIRRIGADDWRKYREIRLRMLADTPLAYNETLEQAQARPEHEWRAKAGRGDGPGSTLLVAEDEDGAWLGVMGGWVSPAHGPMLVGVFVDPSSRGKGLNVADALLDGIIAWAEGEGSALALEVHAENERAIRFYARRGFVATGRSIDYTLPPYGQEIEMRLNLGKR